MDEVMPWHRLFGLHWIDFLQGLPVQVELEKDLSLKQQFLDLVITRTEPGALGRRLPDGFEDLAIYNLVTFKSYQETLDGWTLNELVGHYVNHRKQSSPSMQDLLPESDFRLFAVCVRFPQNLARQMELRPIQPGVYEVRHFTGNIRIVVVHELPQEPHNSMLHLFSARVEQTRYGAAHYELRSQDATTLLYQLLERYREEGVIMPETLQELYKRTVDEILRKTPPEERVKGLSSEEFVRILSIDEFVKELSPQTREELSRKLKSAENGSHADPASNSPE